MSNQSIQRAASILSLFSYARPQIGVSDIAKETGLPVGTVHGLVRALQDEGFLAQDTQSRKYRLGMRLHELGSIHVATLEINQKAIIPLGYLARETGLVCRLGVLERDVLVVTLDTMPMAESYAAPYIGAAAPAFCTSMGRAILAFMPDDELEGYLERVELVKYTPHTITDPQELREELARSRERGYSLSRQEFLLNLDSLGAPIFRGEGRVCGALSLNGEPEHMEQDQLLRLARKAMDTAGEISRYLGHYQYLDPRARRA